MGGRRRTASVRPEHRPAAASDGAEAGRAGACAGARAAPHRGGRLVDVGAHPGTGDALWRLCEGRGRDAAGAAGAVRGLRGVAAGVAEGGGAGGAVVVVEGEAGGGPRSAGGADGSTEAGGAGVPGRERGGEAVVGVEREVEATEPAGGRDAVHDAAGGLPGAACALQRTVGRGGGLSGVGTDDEGGGRAHRLLREHAGGAD